MAIPVVNKPKLSIHNHSLQPKTHNSPKLTNPKSHQQRTHITAQTSTQLIPHTNITKPKYILSLINRKKQNKKFIRNRIM